MEKQANKLAEMNAESEIDLLDLFHYLVKKIYIIIALTLVGAIIFGVYSFVFATPLYQSTSQIYVVNSKDSVLNLSDLQIGSYLTSDYQHVFDTWEVNQRVIDNLKLPYSVKQLQNMTAISNPSNTRILYITVTSTNPDEAAQIANELASVASSYISDTMLTDPPTLLSQALAPKSPVSPQKARNVVLGALLGGIIAVGILTVVYLVDDKIKTSTDVQKYTNFVPLAVIPVTHLEDNKKTDSKKTNRR